MEGIPANQNTMSNKQSEQYLDELREVFLSTKDGIKRGRIIERLSNLGYKDEVEFLEMEWLSERARYLEDKGISENDVLEDDEGNEFSFYVETYNEEHGVVTDRIRIDIPDYLIIK